MSVRLIALLERLVGRARGGLNVVMVLSMVIFSGISGSKMADVAAVGSVLIPAARRSRQNPGGAVALLAASAVMAETIPPCINLIILGFVANLSIGGLFMAGLLPAALMALALIGAVILLGGDARLPAEARLSTASLSQLWRGAIVTLGLLVIIFAGFRFGVATATEISAFAALYALVVGGAAFRELGPRAAARSFINAATRSGLVLFIVAAAQALAFVLTLQQVPHALAEGMVALSQNAGPWLFLLLSILILIVMGSILEGAAALIIFGPLLIPVAGADRHQRIALWRGSGDRNGYRVIRPAPRAWALWRMSDWRRADRDDSAADARLSWLAAVVPLGDRVRPGSDALASASARLPVGARPLRLETPEHAWRTSVALCNRVAARVRLDRAPSQDMVRERAGHCDCPSRRQPTAALPSISRSRQLIHAASVQQTSHARRRLRQPHRRFANVPIFVGRRLRE